MERNIMWVPWTGAGLEHLHIQQTNEGMVIDSVVIGVKERIPFRLWYNIQTDRDWRVRECTLRLLGSGNQGITLHADGEGHWTDVGGVQLSALQRCIDVDISVTPFTNTLPIRRLSLDPGQAADLLVAYIAVPEMEVRVASQRYSCLESRTDGGRYQYESLTSGFTRELPVDAQGLVLDYPGIWKRIKSDFTFQPHSAVEGLGADGPAPELADKLHLFGQFVGGWEFDWMGYDSDGSIQTIEGKGEWHFAWALEGRAVQDVWILPSREERLRLGVPVDEYGTSIRFYDPTIDAWRVAWSGPVNMNVRTFIARQVGNEIILEGTNAQGLPLRWIFSNITKQAFDWRNLISEDGGQTWRMQEKVEVRRVSSH